jgi:hypothetical protein
LDKFLPSIIIDFHATKKTFENPLAIDPYTNLPLPTLNTLLTFFTCFTEVKLSKKTGWDKTQFNNKFYIGLIEEKVIRTCLHGRELTKGQSHNRQLNNRQSNE